MKLYFIIIDFLKILTQGGSDVTKIYFDNRIYLDGRLYYQCLGALAYQLPACANQSFNRSART